MIRLEMNLVDYQASGNTVAYWKRLFQREDEKCFRITASLLKTTVFSDFVVFEFEYRSFLSLFISLSLSVGNTISVITDDKT